MAKPYIEFSTVRVIKPITDLSLGAAAGKVVDAVPIGTEGTIVHIHDRPDLPLAYEVEFTQLADDEHWLLAILHDELEVTWSPDPAPSGGPFRMFERVWRINRRIGVSMLAFAPPAFLLALFLHQRSFGAAGIAIIAVGMASNAALEASRIWWVLDMGRWTGWKQEPIWRNEQPARFWLRSVMHAAILAVCAAAALFLIGVSLNMMLGR